MSYAIVFSSRTGNTRRLAEAVRAALPAGECLYFGPPSAAALAAGRLYIGFWTDKGSCDEALAAFLSGVEGKEVFLFGTAGFGSQPAYFQAVRQRYEAMLAAPGHAPNLEAMIENFDRALSHPDAEDLARLTEAVRA